MPKKMEAKEREIVRKWFPVLLKEDPSFREEVMVRLSSVLATKDDIAKILAKLEEHSKTLAEHTKRIDKFERTLSAIGARWYYRRGIFPRGDEGNS